MCFIFSRTPFHRFIQRRINVFPSSWLFLTHIAGYDGESGTFLKKQKGKAAAHEQPEKWKG